MLHKPPRITVDPGKPGQSAREASYTCTSYTNGGAADGGGYGGGTGSEAGLCFYGVGTPYVPVAGEVVYVGGGCSWEQATVGDPDAYECVWGTSEPVSTPSGTTFVTAAFCKLKSGGGFSGGT